MKTLLYAITLAFCLIFLTPHATLAQSNLQDILNDLRNAADDIIEQQLELIEARYQANLAFLAAASQTNPDITRRQLLAANGFIHSQRGYPQGRLTVGAASNGSASGCGPFAIFNAILYLNGGENPPCPAHIIRWLEIDSVFNLDGRLGINPGSLHRYLVAHGYDAAITHFPRVTDRQIRSADVSIFLYIGDWRRRYVHYVMVRHDAQGFWVYNHSGNTPANTASVDAWVSRLRYRPMAVITIN
ncbi:MAG: hypothetical protein FWC78_04640 [Defluviitaleaceae bacterium]|nr:hypothetical protein [Defluviitaleaceae bacterium]